MLTIRSTQHDPYNQGTHGICQICYKTKKLVWSSYYGFRTCYRCQGR